MSERHVELIREWDLESQVACLNDGKSSPAMASISWRKDLVFSRHENSASLAEMQGTPAGTSIGVE